MLISGCQSFQGLSETVGNSNDHEKRVHDCFLNTQELSYGMAAKSFQIKKEIFRELEKEGPTTKLACT